MALTRNKTWGTKEQLTSSDLNTELNTMANSGGAVAGAETVSGRWTFSGGVIVNEIVAIDAAAAGDIKVAEVRWDPVSGTATDADGFYISWMADDDGGTETEYGRQHLELDDVSAASDDSSWHWSVMKAGTLTDVYNLTGNTATYSTQLTVGVDDTGYDVQFFGATAGSHMLWDESADDLKLVGAAGLTVAGTTTLAGALVVDDTTDSTSGTTGSIQTDGGIGAVKDIFTDATLNAAGDTAAGDNAAMGYTATEGLVLTGQGSTNDITLKNDADVAVLEVATGATTVKIAGGIGAAGATPAATGIRSNGDVIAVLDGTNDLGSTSVRWANVYTDNIGDTGQDLTVLATTTNLPSGHVTDYNGADVTVTHAANVLAIEGGNVGIGTTGPNAKVEIVDNGMSPTQVFLVVQDDQNPYGLIVANETYTSGTDTNGLRVAQLNNGDISFGWGGSTRMTWSVTGSVIVGTAAIATSATDGFLYIPSMAGAPSGTPTDKANLSAIVHDTTNNRFYLYDHVSNAWQYATLT